MGYRLCLADPRCCCPARKFLIPIPPGRKKAPSLDNSLASLPRCCLPEVPFYRDVPRWCSSSETRSLETASTLHHSGWIHRLCQAKAANAVDWLFLADLKPRAKALLSPCSFHATS